MALSYRDRLAYEDVPEPRLEHFKIDYVDFGVYKLVDFSRFDGRRWCRLAVQYTLGM